MSRLIIVNGEIRTLSAETVRELLSECGVEPDRPGIAVALNAEVVPRGAWAETRLGEDDRVEIVQARAGG
jgi:sulfur carrier protein